MSAVEMYVVTEFGCNSSHNDMYAPSVKVFYSKEEAYVYYLSVKTDLEKYLEYHEHDSECGDLFEDHSYENHEWFIQSGEYMKRPMGVSIERVEVKPSSKEDDSPAYKYNIWVAITSLLKEEEYCGLLEATTSTSLYNNYLSIPKEKRNTDIKEYIEYCSIIWNKVKSLFGSKKYYNNYLRNIEYAPTKEDLEYDGIDKYM
jgi:hypothetical protein